MGLETYCSPETLRKEPASVPSSPRRQTHPSPSVLSSAPTAAHARARLVGEKGQEAKPGVRMSLEVIGGRIQGHGPACSRRKCNGEDQVGKDKQDSSGKQRPRPHPSLVHLRYSAFKTPCPPSVQLADRLQVPARSGPHFLPPKGLGLYRETVL